MKVLFTAALLTNSLLLAQSGPTMAVPSLNVRTIVSELEMPMSMAFLAPNDFLNASSSVPDSATSLISKTRPTTDVFVVSISNGAVYEVFRR